MVRSVRCRASREKLRSRVCVVPFLLAVGNHDVRPQRTKDTFGGPELEF